MRNYGLNNDVGVIYINNREYFGWVLNIIVIV